MRSFLARPRIPGRAARCQCGSRAGPTRLPAPGTSGCLLLDLQRGHLPLFVQLVVEGAHDVRCQRRKVFLGVHDGSSWGDDPRSPETPQPTAALVLPESAARRCLRLRLIDHAVPGSPVSLRRRVPPHEPRLDPHSAHLPRGCRTVHAAHSRSIPTALKGRRPCYSNHVTPPRLPPSAVGSRPLSNHAPSRWSWTGWPRPLCLGLAPPPPSHLPCAQTLRLVVFWVMYFTCSVAHKFGTR